MKTPRRKESSGCQEFRGELEALPLSEKKEEELDVFRALVEQMSPASQGHASECAECREATEDLAVTRSALRPLGEVSAEPGPWFAARVMAAIRAQETELDLRDAVWVSIRRLAPRLVAICALLLVLASTWTYQLRRMEVTGPPPTGSNETILEPGQAAPLNDDVLISANEGHR
jgi:hypothetical protein